MDNCLRPGQQIAVIANAIAVALAKNLTPTEENVIGNLIVQVGSTLLAIAAIDQACQDSNTTSTSTSTSTTTSTSTSTTTSVSASTRTSNDTNSTSSF